MVPVNATLSRSRTLALVLAVPLLTAGLAGCVGSEEPDAPWSSYEDAKSAPGPTFSPNGTDSPIQVKWLQPSTPDSVPQAQSELWLLVFDSEADEPVTDATLTMESYMPAMGHGTSAEEDPAHEDFGLYRGVINPSMGGEWQLNLTVQLGSGETLDYVISYNAEGEGGMDDGHGDHGHDHGNETDDTNQTDGNETSEPDGNQTDEEEPEGFNATFNDTIEADTGYERDWAFPVNSTNFTVEATIALDATEPTAEANLTLIDANGTDLDSTEVSGTGEAEGTVTIDDPPSTGEYTARVTGSAVDASYELTIEVG